MKQGTDQEMKRRIKSNSLLETSFTLNEVRSLAKELGVKLPLRMKKKQCIIEVYTAVCKTPQLYWDANPRLQLFYNRVNRAVIEDERLPA